jgi:predicted amidohydrolase
MSRDTLELAVITEVFFGDGADARLVARLAEARRREAELAILPELPLDPWVPATRKVREEDAEPPAGPRHRLLSGAARAVGIGVVGGAIVRQPDGQRHNTALVFDARGDLVAGYRKCHLPEEEGYWETSHYGAGTDPPPVVRRFSLPFGLQICSDVNRPEGCHLLGAMGAEIILAPRCTPRSSYARWLLVLRANAVTSTCYVVSTNRPQPEHGVPIGGPSVVIAPDGEVLLETTAPLEVISVEHGRVVHARREYPGYLPVRAGLYAQGWRQVDDAGQTSLPSG